MERLHPDLKTVMGASPSRVQIPAPPPNLYSELAGYGSLLRQEARTAAAVGSQLVSTSTSCAKGPSLIDKLRAQVSTDGGYRADPRLLGLGEPELSNPLLLRKES